MSHSKTESKFTFEEKYFRNSGSSQTAYVYLTIDYRSKTFNVEPCSGSKSFTFKDNSHEWKMWKAVATLIQEAIDFATKELKLK